MHTNANKDLSTDLIIKSFKTTGYMVNLDGSENEQVLWKIRREESIFEEISIRLKERESNEIYEFIDDMNPYRSSNEVDMDFADEDEMQEGINSSFDISESEAENDDSGKDSTEEVHKMISNLQKRNSTNQHNIKEYFKKM